MENNMEQEFMCVNCQEPYVLECALEITKIEAECVLCNEHAVMKKSNGD